MIFFLLSLDLEASLMVNSEVGYFYPIFVRVFFYCRFSLLSVLRRWVLFLFLFLVIMPVKFVVVMLSFVDENESVKSVFLCFSV